MKLKINLNSVPVLHHFPETASRPIIFLTYLERIPPHIAMVFRDHYYSYDLQKFDQKIPINRILNFFNKKNEKIIGWVLKPHPVFSLEHMEEMYACWEPHPDYFNTCLSPVEDFCKRYYPISISKTMNIPRFLNELNQSGYFESIIFHNFNEKKECVTFNDYPPHQKELLLKSGYVPQG